MKITLGTFKLADHDHTGPSALRINGRRVVQLAEFLRGDAARPYARKNRVTTVTFSVSREHASMRAAGQYLLEHETAVPDSGVLMIEEVDEYGGYTRRYLKHAACDAVESQRIGVTTIHTYSIVGGKMSESAT